MPVVPVVVEQLGDGQDDQEGERPAQSHSALSTASRPSAFSDLGHSTEELMSTS